MAVNTVVAIWSGAGLSGSKGVSVRSLVVSPMVGVSTYDVFDGVSAAARTARVIWTVDTFTVLDGVVGAAGIDSAVAVKPYGKTGGSGVGERPAAGLLWPRYSWKVGGAA